MESSRKKSALEAVKVSLLYLYQAYKEDGMTEDDAKSEVAYHTIEELKNLGMMVKNINIHLDQDNLDNMNRLYKQVDLLVNSKQSHVSQVGAQIARLLTELFN